VPQRCSFPGLHDRARIEPKPEPEPEPDDDDPGDRA
jgi:hypothetical protein